MSNATSIRATCTQVKAPKDETRLKRTVNRSSSKDFSEIIRTNSVNSASLTNGNGKRIVLLLERSFARFGASFSFGDEDVDDEDAESDDVCDICFVDDDDGVVDDDDDGGGGITLALCSSKNSFSALVSHAILFAATF